MLVLPSKQKKLDTFGVCEVNDSVVHENVDFLNAWNGIDP